MSGFIKCVFINILVIRSSEVSESVGDNAIVKLHVNYIGVIKCDVNNALTLDI